MSCMSTSSYYNALAASYPSLHKDEQYKKLSIIQEKIKNRLKKNSQVLDVGCGPCWSATFFPHVFGVDPSFELLDKRRTVVCGYAEQLPFRSQLFDVILCVTALHHFDFDRALPEMKRVAYADALFVISLLKKSSRFDVLRAQIISSFRLIEEVDEGIDMIYVLQ